MATYVYPATAPSEEDFAFNLQEHHIYGSSRIGIVKSMPAVDETLEHHYQQYTSFTHYELSNHLGNVMATITDHKTLVLDNGFFSHYEAVIVSATDYYPYGWSMPGRHIDSDKYRFGFNGKENDDEWGKQDFHARIYDGRVGRWLSLDPMAGDFGGYSPYIFAVNMPIVAVDKDGEAPWFVTGAIGDAVNVLVGFTVSKIQGEEYDIKDVALDFGEGFLVGSGVGLIGKSVSFLGKSLLAAGICNVAGGAKSLVSQILKPKGNDGTIDIDEVTSDAGINFISGGISFGITTKVLAPALKKAKDKTINHFILNYPDAFKRTVKKIAKGIQKGLPDRRSRRSN